ncbi:MAG: AEC family transporter [Brevinematia bacterium]
MLFLKVLFPVLIVIVLSYILSKYRKVDPFNLSVLSMYILSPALILRAFDMYGDFLIKNFLLVSIHLTVQTIVMFLISRSIASILKFSNRSTYSLILLSFLPNTGNIGIPVTEFYLGTKASSFATLVLVVTSIITQTYGVYLASRGVHSSGDSLKDLKNSLKNVLTLPLIYTVLLGTLLTILGVKLPFFLKEPVYWLGFSALVMGLVQLGVILSKTKIELIPVKFVIIALLLKLIVSPCIAFLIGNLLGFRGLELKVITLQYAMPSALYCSILSSYFNLIPRTVGISVFFSTIIGFASLYGLIELLQILPD